MGQIKIENSMKDNVKSISVYISNIGDIVLYLQ